MSRVSIALLTRDKNGYVLVYHGPGDVGTTVQERGRMSGHGHGSTQVSPTARQTTADVQSSHAATQVLHWTALRFRRRRHW